MATVAGDANLDGAVNLTDLGVLIDNFGKPGVWANGDFNNDGRVDLSDLGILIDNFGKSFSPSLPPTVSLAATVSASVASTDNSMRPDVTPSAQTDAPDAAAAQFTVESSVTMSVVAGAVYNERQIEIDGTTAAKGSDLNTCNSAGAEYIESHPADATYNGTYAIVTTYQMPAATIVAPSTSNVTNHTAGHVRANAVRTAVFASVGEVLELVGTNSVKADWPYV
jgi:hypothetical protein